MEQDLNDSSDDMFITQSAPEYEFLEQNEDYDCSYLNSQYEENWLILLGEVEYVDFSNQHDNSSEVPQVLENDYTIAHEQNFEHLVAEGYFGDDENVSFFAIFGMHF